MSLHSAALEANLAAVKGTVQCPEVAEEETYLKSSGKDLRGRCPLPSHDGDSPSFYCYENNGFYDSWYCHRCSRGGDVIDLYGAMHGLDHNIVFAMEALADRFGLKLWRDTDFMSDAQQIVHKEHTRVRKAFAQAVAEHYFKHKVIPFIRVVEDEKQRADLLRRCIKLAEV